MSGDADTRSFRPFATLRSRNLIVTLPNVDAALPWSLNVLRRMGGAHATCRRPGRAGPGCLCNHVLVDTDDWEQAGLYNPGSPGADERRALLVYLTERGA